MLWMALRWNLGNSLPIAAFCLLTMLTIGEAWSANPTVNGTLSGLHGESIVTSSNPTADLRQPAMAIVLGAN